MEKTDHILRMVYSPEEIALRVSGLAARINQRYAQEPLTVVCVLKGAFMLFADLVRQLKMPVQTDFVRLSSYGGQTFSCREIRLIKDVDCELDGCNVLIVEDIVDTGHSMNCLLREFEGRGAKSLALTALVDKPERREVDVKIDFAGFHGAGGFLVGYGLDFAEKYRELPAIYELCFAE